MTEGIFEYRVALGNVLETMSGSSGVAFRVPSPNGGRSEWYVAIPGAKHVAGPFVTRNMAQALIDSPSVETKKRRRVRA
jgi:hypothetical protein